MIPEIKRVENRPGDVVTWRILNAWGYGFEIRFTGYGVDDLVTFMWITGHPPEKHVDIVSMSAGEFVRHVFGAVKDARITELENENARLRAEVEALRSACMAAIKYDEEIRRCANDPNVMDSHCTAQGETLDMLYDSWQSKARAALCTSVMTDVS